MKKTRKTLKKSSMFEIFKKLEKYNFWEKSEIKSGYLRYLYLNKIKKFLNNDLVKVIIGQRRVGKSYVLRQLIQHLIQEQNINPQNIFYLNKEIIDFDQIQTYVELNELFTFYKEKLKPEGKVYIFLDEVQEITGWEKIVNSWSQDYKDTYEVFISGSNSKMLSSELATYLSGRYISFEVLPFAYAEFIDYLKKERNKQTYLEFLSTGGLPELFALQDNEAKRYYVSALRDTVLLKDIVQKHQIKDAYLLEKIFLFLTDNLGNLFSIQGIVDYLEKQKHKTNVETVSNYLKYLSETFLIHETERYDLKGKKILAGPKKYYVNDLAFRNYLSSGFDYGLGGHLENAVYLYYRQQGFQIYVGKIGDFEVDFVVEKNNEKKYIQVTHSLSSESVIEREFGNLQKINDSYEKIVISLDDLSFGNKEGIKHILAWELENNFR